MLVSWFTAKWVYPSFSLSVTDQFIDHVVSIDLQGIHIHDLFSYHLGTDRVQLLEEALIVAGQYETTQFTPNGVAGIFGLYTLPGASLRDAFMNEFFVVCSFSLLRLWDC